MAAGAGVLRLDNYAAIRRGAVVRRKNQKHFFHPDSDAIAQASQKIDEPRKGRDADAFALTDGVRNSEGRSQSEPQSERNAEPQSERNAGTGEVAIRLAIAEAQTPLQPVAFTFGNSDSFPVAFRFLDGNSQSDGEPERDTEEEECARQHRRQRDRRVREI